MTEHSNTYNFSNATPITTKFLHEKATINKLSWVVHKTSSTNPRYRTSAIVNYVTY